MPFKFDFLDGDVLEWTTSDQGAKHTRVEDYTPTIYVGVRGDDRALLDELQDDLRRDPKTTRVEREQWFVGLRSAERSPVLRVDLDRIDEVRTTAQEIKLRGWDWKHAPSGFKLFNVDFSEEFRYCLEQGIDPTPATDLELLELSIDEKPLADRDVTALRLDDEPIAEDIEGVLLGIVKELERSDPDILLLNTAQVITLLYEVAKEYGADWFELGRLSGYQQLAGENVFESYGMIGHSPARYNVPGRAIIDKSNSFLWSKSGLHGLLGLTERSWKPIQESGWASIGNLLTAIQIRKAYRNRDLLIPLDKYKHEFPKPVKAHHDGDRGGYIFDPDVGLHENVHELDFASLFPNIMVVYNVSPDTVNCSCHPDRTIVPGLDYNICKERGLIPEVLEPIIEDRERIKSAIAATEDPDVLKGLEERSDAWKWILVTCFGYQGYKNSKFGRIEAHEAINAFARDILLTAKETFEAGGWRVVHGITDSIWVEAAPGREQEPLDHLASSVTDSVGIRLEYEGAFDWLCPVPKRGKETGALTKYFGKRRGEDEFKLRGIESRQRSTPAFIESVQRELMEVLDRHREPAPVCDRLQVHLSRLRAGDVDPGELAFRKKASKRLENYDNDTHTVAALLRYEKHGIDRNPGQDVRYVVVDDDARRAERVRLPIEEFDRYDTDVYSNELIRAAESIVSPLGWDDDDIRRHLRKHSDASLAAFE